MYPARFEYFAPTTIADAIDLLERHGEDAKILAGGQSLIPLMKLRFASPAVLVDINGVAGLDTLAEEGGVLRIGALVRHKTMETAPILRGKYGLLADAARMVADPLVRNRGTVVGSLTHADPQGDWGSVMLAAGAEIVAVGPSGARTIPIGEFFKSTFTTSIAANEVVTEVRVPDPGPGSGGTYLKLERKVGDYATAAVAVQLTISGGRIAQAGIALTGVGATNIKATAAEHALVGKAPGEATFKEAARLAAEAADPRSDVRGSAEYKRNVVRVYTERGLQAAAASAA